MYIMCVTMLVAVGGAQLHGGQAPVETIYLPFTKEVKSKVSKVACMGVYNVVVDHKHL